MRVLVLLLVLTIIIIDANSFEFANFLRKKKDSSSSSSSGSSGSSNGISNSGSGSSDNDVVKYYAKANGKTIDTNSNDAMIALHTYFPPYPSNSNGRSIASSSNNDIINVHKHGTSPTNGTDIISHPIALIKCNNQVSSSPPPPPLILIILQSIDTMYVTSITACQQVQSLLLSASRLWCTLLLSNTRRAITTSQY